MARTRRKAERGTRAFVGVWIDCFARHDLLTYASAIAFQIAHASAGLIVFGVALMIWGVSGSVRATMGAMNQIYDTEEERSRWQRLGISVGPLAKHLGGSAHALVDVGRWIVAVLRLGVAVELLMRFCTGEAA